ncbi:MAG: endonuclease/exonuclease/phosphatase family protein, partial [Polyangia bacterium]|nr:endonuclease/exonuclease/phosphatase family protein [Polyangia bacterium]
MTESSNIQARLRLRALTINTWAIRGRSEGARLTMARLCELVRRFDELRPDLVLCQEVWRGREAAVLKAAPSLPHYVQSDDYSSDRRLGAGLLVLSRHPLEPARERTYSVDAPGRVTRRSALFTRTTLGDGSRLSIVNTHLIDNPSATLGPHLGSRGEAMFLGGPRHDPLEANRATQLRELFGWIDAHTEGPLLLGGDLNTGPQYPLWFSFLSELAQSRPELWQTISLSSGVGHTYDNQYSPTGRSEGQLDHLIGLRGAQVTEARVALTEPFDASLPPTPLQRWLRGALA